MLSAARDHLGPQELEQGRRAPSLSLLEGAALPTLLDFNVWPPESREDGFVLFQAPASVVLHSSSPRAQITGGDNKALLVPTCAALDRPPPVLSV